jgi:hypothetical protein
MADEGAASELTCLLAGRGDPDRLRAGRRRQRARRLAARRHLTEQGRGRKRSGCAGSPDLRRLRAGG